RQAREHARRLRLRELLGLRGRWASLGLLARFGALAQAKAQSLLLCRASLFGRLGRISTRLSHGVGVRPRGERGEGVEQELEEQDECGNIFQAHLLRPRVSLVCCHMPPGLGERTCPSEERRPAALLAGLRVCAEREYFKTHRVCDEHNI